MTFLLIFTVSSIFSRLAYVKYAHRVIKNDIKYLYISLFIVFGMYVLNRNLSWTYAHLLHGSNLYRMPKGIFCLAKNLTEVIENIDKNQKKEFHQVTSYRGKIAILANTILYDLTVTYFFMASIRSR